LYARLFLFQPLDEEVEAGLRALVLVYVLLHGVDETGHHLGVCGLVLDVFVHAFGGRWWPVAAAILVNLHVHHALHHGLEDELVVICAITFSLLVLVRFQSGQEPVDALGEAVIDDAFVLESLDLVPAVVTFLVYLGLFGANEGLLVDIWVHFDVAVVGQLEGVLCRR
jgi:hypothetical protein